MSMDRLSGNNNVQASQLRAGPAHGGNVPQTEAGPGMTGDSYVTGRKLTAAGGAAEAPKPERSLANKIQLGVGGVLAAGGLGSLAAMTVGVAVLGTATIPVGMIALAVGGFALLSGVFDN